MEPRARRLLLHSLGRGLPLLGVLFWYVTILNHYDGATAGADIGGAALGPDLVIVLAAVWAGVDARRNERLRVIRTWLVAAVAFGIGYAVIAVVKGGESAGQLTSDLALLVPVMFALVAAPACLTASVVPARADRPVR